MENHSGEDRALLGLVACIAARRYPVEANFNGQFVEEDPSTYKSSREVILFNAALADAHLAKMAHASWRERSTTRPSTLISSPNPILCNASLALCWRQPGGQQKTASLLTP